mgnify:CR=1 FL=1
MKALRLLIASGLTALSLGTLPGTAQAQALDCTIVAVGIGIHANEIRTELNRHLAGQRFELAMPGRYLTVHEISRVVPLRNCRIEVQLRVELRRPALRNLHGTTIVRGTIAELRPWTNDIATLRAGTVRPCHVRIFGLEIAEMGLGGIAGNLRNSLHRIYGNRILRTMQDFRIC